MREGSWTAQYTINADAAVVSTWTNMPTAETLLFGSNRHVIMISVNGMTYVRLKVNRQATNASAGSKLILRYSPTFSSTVSDYVDIGVTEVSVPIDTANSYVASAWVEINPDCFVNDDIYVAVIGSGNNGNFDPQFGNISIGLC